MTKQGVNMEEIQVLNANQVRALLDPIFQEHFKRIKRKKKSLDSETFYDLYYKLPKFHYVRYDFIEPFYNDSDYHAKALYFLYFRNRDLVGANKVYVKDVERHFNNEYRLELGLPPIKGKYWGHSWVDVREDFQKQSIATKLYDAMFAMMKPGDIFTSNSYSKNGETFTIKWAKSKGSTLNILENNSDLENYDSSKVNFIANLEKSKFSIIDKIRKVSKSLKHSSLVATDIEEYVKAIHIAIADLLEYSIEKIEKSRKSSLTKELVRSAIAKAYGSSSPYIERFWKDPEDWGSVFQVYKAMLSETDMPFELLKIMREYIDVLSNEGEVSESDLRQEYLNTADRLIIETNQNAQALSDVLFKAVRRIEGWKAPIWITAHAPYNSREVNLEQGANSFQVSVGRKDISFFAMLQSTSVVIDDVLEGGDTDLFRNNEEQEDYFDLIKELRNPGSTSKPGKKKVLYTARPVKDRNRYEGAKDIPVNIFLSSDVEDALGLASDLAGNGVRDLWKVVIEDRYLIQTLDGRVKHYQTTGRGSVVPIYRMELLIPGS